MLFIKASGPKKHSSNSQLKLRFSLVLSNFIQSVRPGPLGQVRANMFCQPFDLFVHFFARPKKRTKKRTPVAFGPSDCLRFSKLPGFFKLALLK